MKKYGPISLFLIFIFAIAGCAGKQTGQNVWPLKNFSPIGLPSRIHSFGMILYDKSGNSFSEKEWERKLKIVGDVYSVLRSCLGFEGDGSIDRQLRKVPVVVLPPEKIPGHKDDTAAVVYADWASGSFGIKFTGATIFIRDDDFYPYILRHEWLHVYIYLVNIDAGKEIQGDNHANPLFKKCAF